MLAMTEPDLIIYNTIVALFVIVLSWCGIRLSRQAALEQCFVMVAVG